jgi:hypothetical protein
MITYSYLTRTTLIGLDSDNLTILYLQQIVKMYLDIDCELLCFDVHVYINIPVVKL